MSIKPKMFIDYRKEPYMCSVCNTFHTYLTKGKQSKTHLEHYAYFTRYESDFDQSELFKLSFKKSWKREANKQPESKCLICNDTGINTHVEYDEIGLKTMVDYPCQCRKLLIEKEGIPFKL